MRVTDNNKKFGFFWILSNNNIELEEKDKIPGTLSIKDGGQIQLELFSSSCVQIERQTPRIVGTVEDFGPVTLDDCLYHRHNFSCGVQKWFLSVETALIGVQYKANEKLQFYTFQFYIEGLHQWIINAGIKREKDDYKGNFSVKYKIPNEIIYKLDNNIQLSFGYLWGQYNKRNTTELSLQIKERIYCKLTSLQDLSLQDFILTTQRIHSFLCFVMDDIVRLTDVTVTSKTIQDKSNNPVNIKVYYQSRPFIKNNPRLIVPLFLFEYMKNNMEKILNNWIALYNQTDPALKLYLSTQTEDYRFLEDKFLTLVQSLEAYHQRKFCKKKMYLRDRLKELIEPLKAFITFHNEQQLITDIIDTRNYFTHFNPEKESKALRRKELFYLCLKMEGILQVTLLKDIDLSSSQVETIINQSGRCKDQLKYKINLLQPDHAQL